MISELQQEEDLRELCGPHGVPIWKVSSQRQMGVSGVTKGAWREDHYFSDARMQEEMAA